MVFQPIVDVHRDTAVGAEALTRFEDRGRSISQWLADAESVGLLVPLELALARAALLELPNLEPGWRWPSTSARPRSCPAGSTRCSPACRWSG